MNSFYCIRCGHSIPEDEINLVFANCMNCCEVMNTNMLMTSTGREMMHIALVKKVIQENADDLNDLENLDRI
jgi:hypothetical protein